jgi:predicted  nucleic acid-binding Zn-ribbon protein
MGAGAGECCSEEGIGGFKGDSSRGIREGSEDSNGLRDRIGTLDEKRGKVLRKLEEVEGREMALKGEIEALRHSSRMDIERLEKELKEARSAAVVTVVETEKQVETQSRLQVLSAVEQPAITR